MLCTWCSTGDHTITITITIIAHRCMFAYSGVRVISVHTSNAQDGKTPEVDGYFPYLKKT